MDYSSRRAEQEREAARMASHERARHCHEQLAEFHSAGIPTVHSSDAEGEQCAAGTGTDFIVLQ